MFNKLPSAGVTRINPGNLAYTFDPKNNCLGKGFFFKPMERLESIMGCVVHPEMYTTGISESQQSQSSH